MDLTDIYRLLQPKAKEYSIQQPMDFFPKIDHILNHKRNL